MTPQETLRSLPPDQKLAIVTQLWDDLAASAPLTLRPDELAEEILSKVVFLND